MSVYEDDSPPVRRQRRRPGENRDLLIDAGILEFALHGYHGASTSAIAARASVPQPHVYASFRAKSELFVACAQRVAHRPLEERCSGIEAAMVLQTFSALGEGSLAIDLHPFAARLRERLGDARIGELLLRGATELAAAAHAQMVVPQTAEDSSDAVAR